MYIFPMPLRPAYPDDFLAWVTSLARFTRLSAHQHPGCDWVFTFDSQVHMQGHKPGLTHRSTFYLSPQTVVGSVNWRRLAAGHIRAVRFACRRHTNPASVIGKQPPKLPWPQ